jgi:hypothetical protein
LGDFSVVALILWVVVPARRDSPHVATESKSAA